MFVLISKTRGDDLVSSTQSVIAGGEDKERLKQLLEDRKEKRSKYLASTPLPCWAYAGVIENEWIEEVKSI